MGERPFSWTLPRFLVLPNPPSSGDHDAESRSCPVDQNFRLDRCLRGSHRRVTHFQLLRQRLRSELR